jgi:hypothetical protein
VQCLLGIEKLDKDDKKKIRINNKILYYLFLFGTELGEKLYALLSHELFYQKSLAYLQAMNYFMEFLFLFASLTLMALLGDDLSSIGLSICT